MGEQRNSSKLETFLAGTFVVLMVPLAVTLYCYYVVRIWKLFF